MRNKLFAAVAALAVATPVMAEPLQLDVIAEQLAEADRIVEQQKGAYSIETTLRGSLDDGEERFDTVRLSAGGDYVVIGLCDNDCSDFDLVVNDADGNEVGSDYLKDDVPMVNLSDAQGGIYQIQSLMADCSIDPCATAVRVYRVD